jgi:hypothetical protein
VESSCECGNESSGSLNAGKVSSDYTTCGLSNSAELHRISSLVMALRHPTPDVWVK